MACGNRDCLPLYNGLQLAIDTTIVSPLRADGAPRPRAAFTDGVALADAVRVKNRTYHEVVASRRCHLLVAAVEVGGRWDESAYRFLVRLAKAKVRQSPAVLRKALVLAWLRRWTGMLAHSIHDAFAATLVEEVPREADGTDGDAPPQGSLLSLAAGGA